MKQRIHYSIVGMALCLVVGLLGCSVTPPDVEPVVTPDEYIFAECGDTVVVIGVEWWEIFGDTTLNRLMVEAIANNQDLAVAASNVMVAQQQLISVRASLAPGIDVGVSAEATYTSPPLGTKKEIEQSYSILPKVSWEASLFGGIRGASDAARQELVATEWGYRAARLALEAQVATTYFQWLQYARSLEISERSYQLRLQAQQMTDSLYNYGFASGIDLQQARSLTATAATNIPSYRRAMVQTNLILNTLLGGEPELLPMPSHSRECAHSQSAQLDGLYCGHLTAAPLPSYVPSGLPSLLLERRPDVMEAYHKMEAAAAKTRVARAARFPSIALTGQGGLLSSTLKGLTSKNPAYWSAALSLTQPIIHFGALKAEELQAAEAWRQSMLNYQKSILTAFSDVESALVAVATYNEEALEYLDLLRANNRLKSMTAALYADGLASSLNYIDAERNLYSAQLEYISLLSEQLCAYVDLYKALGGGW